MLTGAVAGSWYPKLISIYIYPFPKLKLVSDPQKPRVVFLFYVGELIRGLGVYDINVNP